MSIVIPVYRSRDSLTTLYKQTADVMDTHGVVYEIIFVDDNSPDGSWKVLSELHRRYPGVISAMQLMRNFGQHNALMCGFRYAQGEFIITMDDDLQNPPKEIPKLLATLREGGYDVVYGVPVKKRHALCRNVSSRLVNAFFQLVFQTRVCVSPFRAIRRDLLDAILTYNLNFTYIDGLLAWNTQRVGAIAVEHHDRPNGRSSYSLAKLITLAFNLFTNFSLIPLQVASVIGLMAAGGGLLAGCWFLAQALLNNIAVPGYASTIVAVLALGGLQLLALGIIGEYIGRLHLNVNRRPQYAIRQVLHNDEGVAPFNELTESATPRKNGKKADKPFEADFGT